MSRLLFWQLALVSAGIMLTLISLTCVRQLKTDGPLRFNWRHPKAFLKMIIVTGTDVDLKVELFFLGSLSLVVALSPNPTGLGPQWPLLATLAVLVGFNLRQWLSGWRLRNIAYLSILFDEHVVYFKSFANFTRLLLVLFLCLYLASLNPALAAASFLGFVAHEVWLESRKSRRLLRRKLYLFDLDEQPLTDATHSKLVAALRRHDLRAVDRLASAASDPIENLLLRAFSALLRDDLAVFHSLLDQHYAVVTASGALISYFGRALYIIGDVERARTLLGTAAPPQVNPLCVVYSGLAALADAVSFEASLESVAILERAPRSDEHPKAEMLSHAFRALALTVSHSKAPNQDPAVLDEALVAIHTALSANDTLLRSGQLGGIARDYFAANHQMFLDIFGYVLYRRRNLSLAFRVLQAAVSADDTYPWPYFHLALIYQHVGRLTLARALYIRIAHNERSNTVLKRLCLRRVEGLDK
jgi:tetratricopeptide (TPR) repeat protein